MGKKRAIMLYTMTIIPLPTPTHFVGGLEEGR